VRIVRVHAVPVVGGFFNDDQAAVLAGAARDGFTYAGPPRTAGFTAVRQPAQAVSVLLELDDGQLAHGDCVGVQYAGVGGRDPVLQGGPAAEVVDRVVGPALVGREVTGFRELATVLADLREDGAVLHSALRYGVSQALLDAAARARRVTMAEVVREEWTTGVDLVPVGVFAQCGDDRWAGVDKMVLRGADALPHGLVNDVATKVGPDGGLLVEYVTWVRGRVEALRPHPTYSPVLHLDVYGTLGLALGGDVERVADLLLRLERAAAPLRLRVEHPVDGGSRSGQIAVMRALLAAVRRRGGTAQLAVDEWCNTLDDVAAFVAAGAADVVHVKVPDLGPLTDTIEALLLVRRNGLLAYCGGSATETERSAQVTAHVAMACGADQVLAKPGMGVDEGMSVVGNEMARVAALVRSRRP
jgi:methylaspartate ammonia-lyase